MKIQISEKLGFHIFQLNQRLENDLTICNIYCSLHLVSRKNPDLYTSSRESLYTRWHSILKFVFYGSTSNQCKILFYQICHLCQFNTLQRRKSFWHKETNPIIYDKSLEHQICTITHLYPFSQEKKPHRTLTLRYFKIGNELCHIIFLFLITRYFTFYPWHIPIVSMPYWAS